jgi:hypothetical protein
MYVGLWEQIKLVNRVGKLYILEMSVTIQFENLTSHPFSKMLQLRIHKTIFPVLPKGVKNGF